MVSRVKKVSSPVQTAAGWAGFFSSPPAAPEGLLHKSLNDT